MNALRGKVAIVGAADTEVGVVPHMGATGLCVDAITRALDDTGISKDDVDGLITCNSMADPSMYHAGMIAEYLQIFPRYCLSVGAGGGTSFAVLHHAASAIAMGVCKTVVVSMADSLRSGMTRERVMTFQSSSGHPQFESPYTPTAHSLLCPDRPRLYGGLRHNARTASCGGREQPEPRPVKSPRANAGANHCGGRVGIRLDRRPASLARLFIGLRWGCSSRADLGGACSGYDTAAGLFVGCRGRLPA